MHKNRINHSGKVAGIWVFTLSEIVALGLTAFTSAQIEFPIRKPTAIVDSCITNGCHTNIIDQKVMHEPAAKSKCLECHEYTLADEHLFVLSKPGNTLCLDCHTMSHSDRVIHKPVADGDCLSCHDPHGSEHGAVLRKDSATLCLDCHQDNYDEHDFVHGPVAVGACFICHEAHSSSFDGLLTDRPNKLCLNCHERLIPSAMEKRHIHKPMEDGCVSCHDPHASDAKFQLHSTVPNLCLECHDDLKEEFENAPILHAPFVEEGGCTKCHNPHFTTLPHLQQQTQPALCLKCHDKAMTTTDGRTLIDMKTFLEENPNHHGPIREGSCTMCHHPHASQEVNLLLGAYPVDFYIPFEMEQYNLCFKCHQEDLVKDEYGTGLTKFRQGDLNLHWLHVNREKGRTCRTCHDVHASKRPAHIRESVPFGSLGWLLKINYEQTPTGGSCAPACHKPKEYDRIEFPLDQLQVGDSALPQSEEVVE